jgi:uncharacterized membrane protein YbhN (UPF0104 family)
MVNYMKGFLLTGLFILWLVILCVIVSWVALICCGLTTTYICGKVLTNYMDINILALQR